MGQNESQFEPPHQADTSCPPSDRPSVPPSPISSSSIPPILPPSSSHPPPSSSSSRAAQCLLPTFPPPPPPSPPPCMHRLNLIRKLGIPASPVGPPPPPQQEAPDRLETAPYEQEEERVLLPEHPKTSPRFRPSPPLCAPSSSYSLPSQAVAEVDVAEQRGAETAFELSTLNVTSSDDFRVNYLRKLSYANVWIPNARKPPQHQTVIIFDWDDTLLSTSYINLRGQEGLTPLALAQLESVARNVISLLELAKKMGRVFIITNAMEGWVEYSVEKYLPSAQQLVTSIKIISARNRYEAAFPGEYYQWKIQAFLEVQRQLNSEIITNLISVGSFLRL
eukprot:GHVS01094445.1.p1 GENE.GHVS01094445.1~~GHVS01094445.1.p1  ORF type:complete len:335 (+),score=80.78 GHVS01094445.1:84-1088(+)